MTPIETYQPPPGLDIVFVDEFLIVLNKPGGLLSVPGRAPGMDDCLSARVEQQFADALVVHRLDMATSGLVVMARGPAMQRALSAAFADRRVQKRYDAVVQGQVDAPRDGWRTIDLPILVDWPRRPLRKIDAAGQPSVTQLQLLDWDAAANTSRLALLPETGRTHQLRLHLQAIGHPILGDALYAPPEVAGASLRLCLHACRLQFLHPATGQAAEFHAPAPF